jgi:multicomponent Na+:H+ antiporter subunit F
MPDVLLTIAIGWMVALLAITVVAVLRARTTPVRILALDTVSLVMIAALALVGARDGRAYALDAALMLALLSFISTLAAARFFASGRIAPGREERP